MKITQAIFAGSCQHLGDKPKRKAPEFAFIGRSNVGKSSLINSICGMKDLAHTSATPGKTILINHFLINDYWYLVDLPGYGFAKMAQKKRAQIQTMIQDYIGKSEELTTLFILLDARHGLMDIDLDFISAVADADVPFAVVFTKCDKKEAQQKTVEGNIKGLTEHLGKTPHVFVTSAQKGIGREDVLDFIEETLKNNKLF